MATANFTTKPPMLCMKRRRRYRSLVLWMRAHRAEPRRELASCCGGSDSWRRSWCGRYGLRDFVSFQVTMDMNIRFSTGMTVGGVVAMRFWRWSHVIMVRSLAVVWIASDHDVIRAPCKQVRDVVLVQTSCLNLTFSESQLLGRPQAASLASVGQRARDQV